MNRLAGFGKIGLLLGSGRSGVAGSWSMSKTLGARSTLAWFWVQALTSLSLTFLSVKWKG